MLDEDTRPRESATRFVCPHARCGAFAQQSWFDLGMPDEDGFLTYLETKPTASESSPFDGQRINIWRTAQCGACYNWSIWRNGMMVHPQPRLGRPAHDDMPEDVKELYEEASAVSRVSRRAGAAMARVVVERLIKQIDDEAPSNANLAARISRLQGRVSTPLGQMLDVVRVSGNTAVHVDDNPSEIAVMVLNDTEGPELVALLLEVANDLVDELITRPRRSQDLHSRLPESVRARLRNTR